MANYKKIILSILTVISVNACSVFGKQGVDIAPYTVIKAEQPFEIREYKNLVIAKTTVKASYDEMGNIAFKRLFKYISGDNVKQSKIAMTTPVLKNKERSAEEISMTAPVLMTNKNQSWTMAFVLPSTYSLKTAPAPLNPDVTLAEIEKHKAAVLVFSGILDQEAIAEKTKQLTDFMLKNKYKPAGEPIIAGYNPPWTIPMFRRNEIQIPVE